MGLLIGIIPWSLLNKALFPGGGGWCWGVPLDSYYFCKETWRSEDNLDYLSILWPKVEQLRSRSAEAQGRQVIEYFGILEAFSMVEGDTQYETKN